MCRRSGFRSLHPPAFILDGARRGDSHERRRRAHVTSSPAPSWRTSSISSCRTSRLPAAARTGGAFVPFEFFVFSFSTQSARRSHEGHKIVRFISRFSGKTLEVDQHYGTEAATPRAFGESRRIGASKARSRPSA